MKKSSKGSKSEICNHTRGWKRYYDTKDEITNQQNVYYEENREKN